MEASEMWKDHYIYEEALLPRGFRFPDAYLRIMQSPEIPQLTPWWFLGERKELALFWLSTLQEQYPSRLLIPCAKNDQLGDTIAAFDGSDISGNPKLFYIHAYTEPGWEQRGTWDSFDDWLKDAREDAAEFAADDE